MFSKTIFTHTKKLSHKFNLIIFLGRKKNFFNILKIEFREIFFTESNRGKNRQIIFPNSKKTVQSSFSSFKISKTKQKTKILLRWKWTSFLIWKKIFCISFSCWLLLSSKKKKRNYKWEWQQQQQQQKFLLYHQF